MDTSALISAKDYYPPDNFSSFWNYLHKMNLDNKLIILKKVKEELTVGNDYLSNAFFRGKIITEDEDQETIENLKFIINKLEEDTKDGFQRWLKGADPYIIAYTYGLKKQLGDKVILLTGEEEKGEIVKIPFVCRKFDIPFGKIPKLIIEEKINFSID
jgi:hypothetical protein